MATIVRLDDSLISQIAAGEVVERPANIVKELVENALDAEASSIVVEIVEGGRSSIRVVDDGVGMGREDAELSIVRHATSKLRCFDDLMRLQTMGFRGEALASIASVSRFTLRTRRQDDLAGTEIRIDDGPPRLSETGCPVGTSIEVRDLFFNVPARQKFLKARHTEANHIAEILLKIAMANPSQHFVLTSNGRTVREYLPTLGHFARAQSILSDAPLACFEGSSGACHVLAALAAPERARTGTRHLHLFVNGRPVVDRSVAHAVTFAFGGDIAPGAYPVGAVFLSVPPGDLDVNAHPQKTEVRFADLAAVRETITKTIAQVRGTTKWGGGVYGTLALTEVPALSDRHAEVQSVAEPWRETGTRSEGPLSRNPADAVQEVASTPLSGPLLRAGAFWNERLASGPSLHTRRSAAPAPELPLFRSERPSATAPSVTAPSATAPSATAPSATAPSATAPSATAPSATAAVIPHGHLATSALLFSFPDDKNLWVVRHHDSLWLVDAHLLGRERVRTCFSSQTARSLLFPIRVSLESSNEDSLSSLRSALGELGFDIESIGQREIAFHTIPSFPDDVVSRPASEWLATLTRRLASATSAVELAMELATPVATEASLSGFGDDAEVWERFARALRPADLRDYLRLQPTSARRSDS